MINRYKFFTLITLILAANYSSANSHSNEQCSDPAESVMRIMNCIEEENALCAASGYAGSFSKLHNTIDTQTNKPGYFFWLGTFLFIDFELAFDHVENIGENQVSLRYVETVTFNDGDVFKQHEHALVTVTNDCKMELWDQYGDDKEQNDVDAKADSLFPF